jgi:hypothetical protein
MFKGISDDPDLYIPDTKEWISYEWTTNASKDTLSFDNEFKTKLEPGFYKIILTVSDSLGEQSSTEISIKVDINRTLDTDNDGIPNYQDDDDDGDQMPDDWELKYPNILDPLDSTDAKEDNDKDGFSNLEEYLGDDGKVGGSDSTNPERKSDVPDRQTTSKESGEESMSSYAIFAVILVIVVVIILILLFMFMRSKKTEEEPVQPPQPQTQPVPQQVEATAMPPMPTPPPMPMTPMTPEMQMQMQMQMQQQPQYYPYPPFEQNQPAQQSPPQQFGGQPISFPTPGPGQPTTPMGLPQTGEQQPLLEPAREPIEQPEPDYGYEQTTYESTQNQQEADLLEQGTPAQDENEPKSLMDGVQKVCSNCNQPINEGWLVCPNCKNIL